MRLFSAWALAALWPVSVAAQVEEPAPPPVENQPLRNTGKPMILSYLCADEEIRSAGLSCTAEDPCPVFLELASVEAVGNRIFAAGNIHSSSTTLYSVLLSSDDEGRTWHEPHPRIRLAGLDRIQFLDFKNGWVGGEIQNPLPRDPFLLSTSDGGKTWHSLPIFGESQFGSVQHFWFSSRTNGKLAIDRGRTGTSGRYELYETSNGGDSWMLRQTSERIIEPVRAGTGNADWRLRADAASKSYRIEHRSGGAWRTVAAFSVAIGACKPPEVPPPPPEPQGSR